MATSPDSDDSATLSSDEAFSILADSTRLQILRQLGKDDEPLQFSALRDLVGYDASGNFSYHLEKLDGHFIEKGDKGYQLLPRGKRIIIAIESGLVQEEHPNERTVIDDPCPLCGAPKEVEIGPGGVSLFCTECSGAFEHSEYDDEQSDRSGFVGRLELPPTGSRNRTPQEAYRTAQIWANLSRMARSHGVCPKCAGVIDLSYEVCDDHMDEGFCENCGSVLPIHLYNECQNCIYRSHTTIGSLFYGRSPMLKFLLDNGANPVRASAFERPPFDHAVDSRDPFRGRFIYYGDEETFEIAFDDSLEIIDVSRRDVED